MAAPTSAQIIAQTAVETIAPTASEIITPTAAEIDTQTAARILAQTTTQTTAVAQTPVPTPPTTTNKVSWLKRDVLLFNASIGCTADELHFLYENHPHFTPFPTFPLGLNFKLHNQEVIDFYGTQREVSIPGLPVLDPSRLVDGRRKIEFLKTLPVSSAGRDFEIRSYTLGAFDKGKAGTVVKSCEDVVDASTGEVYARITGSLFYVGQGGWGGRRGEPEPSYEPPRGKTPDLDFVFNITAEAAHLYRLNGDYNPLHVDPAVGASMGFGGIILHGVYAYSRVAQQLLSRLGNSSPENFREIEAKFAGVVRPGDEVRTEVWRVRELGKGWTEFWWRASVVETGKACLTDGRAVIRAEREAAARL